MKVCGGVRRTSRGIVVASSFAVLPALDAQRKQQAVGKATLRTPHSVRMVAPPTKASSPKSRLQAPSASEADGMNRHSSHLKGCGEGPQKVVDDAKEGEGKGYEPEEQACGAGRMAGRGWAPVCRPVPGRTARQCQA